MTDPIVIGAKLLPVVKPAGSWLLRRLRPDTSPSGLDAVVYALAEKVKRNELKRLNELQVSHKLAIPVYFVRLVRGEVPGAETVTGSLPAVASFYQGLGDLKRMLVVGAPGSGKTVLALLRCPTELRQLVNTLFLCVLDQMTPISSRTSLRFLVDNYG